MGPPSHSSRRPHRAAVLPGGMGFSLGQLPSPGAGRDGESVTSVLVVDNYDSFVYTLNGYLLQLGAETTVVRNDDPSLQDPLFAVAEFDAILLSPGPGTPGGAGMSIPLVHAALTVGSPLLGVCLGHQAIAEALGATVTVAEELMHGKTSLITHDGSEFFDGVPQPFVATRYHSLAVVASTVPQDLRVTAHTENGIIMGLRHVSAPLFGVQFHPESVLTQGGYQMLANWLAIAGLTSAPTAARGLSPLVNLG